MSALQVFKAEDGGIGEPMLQVVYGEVYAPNRLDAHNEFMTADEIRRMAWAFASKEKARVIDVQHNNKIIKALVVESFIAREGDPDFLPFSWVVGVHIEDPEVWQAVLDGDLNGFSMEALVRRTEHEVELDFPEFLMGDTSEDEGHSHRFTAYYDTEGKFSGGGTDEVNGHTHNLSGGTVTDFTNGHNHRFSAVDGLEFTELGEVD